MFTFIEQYIANYFPCNTTKILLYLEFHVAYLIGLVGKLGFCGEVYSMVHGESALEPICGLPWWVEQERFCNMVSPGPVGWQAPCVSALLKT